MENELISPQTEQRLLHDLQHLIDAKKSGKLALKNYIDLTKAGACMDFAELYEASDPLRNLIDQTRRHGIGIEVEEKELVVNH